MTVLIFAFAVFAAPYVLDVGETVNLGFGGDEPHVFPRDDGGWWVVYGDNGDLYVAPMDSAWNLESEPFPVAGRTDLISNSVAMCPDGSFLHVGASTMEVLADSGWSFRYDADWNLVAEGTIHEGADWLVHKNSPVVCGEVFQGAGFSTPDFGACQAFVHLGQDACVEEVRPLGPPIDEGMPRFEGGGLLWEEETETLLLIERGRWTRYRPGHFDAGSNPLDWDHGGGNPTSGDGQRGSLARFGNCYLDVNTDTYERVWLEVRANPNFDSVEGTQISMELSADAYVLATEGGALMAWSRDNASEFVGSAIVVVEVAIDAEACAALPLPELIVPPDGEPAEALSCPAFPTTGVPPEDSCTSTDTGSEVDTGSQSDTGTELDTEPPPDGEDGGSSDADASSAPACATGAGPAGLGILLTFLTAFIRRK